MILCAMSSFTDLNAKDLPTIYWWLPIPHFIYLNLSRAYPSSSLACSKGLSTSWTGTQGHPSTATHLWRLPRKQGFVVQLNQPKEKLPTKGGLPQASEAENFVYKINVMLSWRFRFHRTAWLKHSCEGEELRALLLPQHFSLTNSKEIVMFQFGFFQRQSTA